MNFPPQGPSPGNLGAPQGYPGPWGPPPQQPPRPQHQWTPGPPPKKRNGWKWALGAVALLAVIGVTAAVAISVTSGNDNGDPPPAGDIQLSHHAVRSYLGNGEQFIAYCRLP